MFGSEGLYSYDLASGQEVWSVDLGVLEAGFFAREASPAGSFIEPDRSRTNTMRLDSVGML